MWCVQNLGSSEILMSDSTQNGMSWKVMKPLALKYDLHPLALEDALHGNTEARSKADYYPK